MWSPARRLPPRRRTRSRPNTWTSTGCSTPRDGPTVLPPGSWSTPIPSLDFRLTRSRRSAVYETYRRWRREPERSRRAIRLAMAHWVAYAESPPGSRPKGTPVPWLTFGFYPLGPEAPAKALALSPRALAGWMRSTIDANFLLGSWGWSAVRASEQANRRALLILLAQELYRRDHGLRSAGARVAHRTLPQEFARRGRRWERRDDPGRTGKPLQ